MNMFKTSALLKYKINMNFFLVVVVFFFEIGTAERNNWDLGRHEIQYNALPRSTWHLTTTAGMQEDRGPMQNTEQEHIYITAPSLT